ncbi:MAG: SDR family NAD(P)-dependent oxidoreductase [Chloroflexota bacterium]
MSTQKRTWFVTGCSTGLGRALAEEVLKAGGRVVATARNQSAIQDLVERYPDTALALSLDVTYSGTGTERGRAGGRPLRAD